MNTEVFLSILAMDSYNRGYGQNVGGLSNTGQIGQASIIKLPNAASVQSAWQSTAFHAIAYSWNGQTVRSYRGTNDSLVVH